MMNKEGKGVLMEIRFRLKRILALSLIFMMTAGFPARADEVRRVDIYLDYSNITLDVYRVGTYDEEAGNRTAALTGEFGDSGEDLGRIWENASSHHEVAADLYEFAVENRVKPYRNSVAVRNSYGDNGKRGKAVVENLEDGIYLFVKSGGSGRISVTPFILTVPYYDQDTSAWLYVIEAYPKCEYKPGSSGGGDGGGDGGGNGGGNPPGKAVDIPPSDVPNAAFPDSPIRVPIEEEPVPLAVIPKLGDSGMAGYLLVALVAAAAGLAAIKKGRKYCGQDE